jgi:hypothetical protein
MVTVGNIIYVFFEIEKKSLFRIKNEALFCLPLPRMNTASYTFEQS